MSDRTKPNPKDPTQAHVWSVLDVAVRCHRRGDCHDIAYAYEDARYAALFREAGDTIDSLRKQLARVEGLYEHLSKYVQMFGPLHEDGCSEDDTCRCVFKPTNEGVSCLCVALAGIDGDAKARREGRA